MDTCIETFTSPTRVPAATLAEANVELEKWCEYKSGAHEAYGETYAQYRGEIAHYGDAWPGAALDVARMSEAIGEIEAEIEALFEDWPQLDPDVDLDGSKARRIAERIAADNVEPF